MVESAEEIEKNADETEKAANEAEKLSDRIEAITRDNASNCEDSSTISGKEKALGTKSKDKYCRNK